MQLSWIRFITLKAFNSMRELLPRRSVRPPLKIPAIKVRSLISRFSIFGHPELAEIYLEDSRTSKVFEILIKPGPGFIDAGVIFDR